MEKQWKHHSTLQFSRRRQSTIKKGWKTGFCKWQTDTKYFMLLDPKISRVTTQLYHYRAKAIIDSIPITGWIPKKKKTLYAKTGGWPDFVFRLQFTDSWMNT